MLSLLDHATPGLGDTRRWNLPLKQLIERFHHIVLLGLGAGLAPGYVAIVDTPPIEKPVAQLDHCFGSNSCAELASLPGMRIESDREGRLEFLRPSIQGLLRETGFGEMSFDLDSAGLILVRDAIQLGEVTVGDGALCGEKEMKSYGIAGAQNEW